MSDREDTSASLSLLRERWAIPGVLSFELDRGLIRLQATTAEANATMYLQGAHLTHWQPACQDPVLFVSRASEFAPGRPIRGGIPVAFPWFATDSKPDRVDGHPGPSHGFARLQDWQLISAKHSAGSLDLTLTQGPTEMSRSMGFDGFLLRLEVEVSAHLGMRLTVRNTGTAPLSFEEALHNYFLVVDVHEATVNGLETAGYIDKIDGMKHKPSSGAAIAFTGPTDRVYLDTAAPCTIHDATQRRDIHIVKTNSRNTVVWNPGKTMPDVGEWDWHEFCCVETANAGANTRTLAPGDQFTMGQTLSVQRWTSGCSTAARTAAEHSPRERE